MLVLGEKMESNSQILVMSELKEIKQEIKSLRTDLIDLGYRCDTQCHKIFLKRDSFASFFKDEMEKYSDKKMKKVSHGIDMLRNILHLLTTLGPYIAMIAGFYAILQRM